MSPVSAPTGNLAAGLDAFLGQLGVVRSQTRDGVDEVLESELAARQHSARVKGLRYGVLTIVTDPITAQLLRYDQDRLLTVLEDRVPGAVTALRICTR